MMVLALRNLSPPCAVRAMRAKSAGGVVAVILSPALAPADGAGEAAGLPVAAGAACRADAPTRSVKRRNSPRAQATFAFMAPSFRDELAGTLFTTLTV